ncbi:MAG: hypothetical protein SFV15_21315 [Polyangiaceae bacterium]|nr:hypothetical protein [Polyangiaceae bacterium]
MPKHPVLRALAELLWKPPAWYTGVLFMKQQLTSALRLTRQTLKNARVEPYIYALFAGTCVLLAACWFYSSMRLQTLYSIAWDDPRFSSWIEGGREPRMGPWSAPLDDVFIHFDFARSIARGHPFEWSVGNGYSSGDTSLLYPFVLAIGYLLGFHGNLMYFAALVACVSVFAGLLAARQMYLSLPRYTSYVAPIVLLSVGALNWSFFSGMEVAFFLGLWGAAFTIWDHACRSSRESGVPWGALFALGLANALLVGTRPEAVTCVAVLSISVTLALWNKLNVSRGLGVLACAVLPGAIVVLGQSLANYIFTGETAAAGAIAKLEIHHPYLTLREVWDSWQFHLVYQFNRVTNYHFSEAPRVGFIVWILAAIPLILPGTRRVALMLWVNIVLWGSVVALNGQVRWQNERYAMPAVAWLLLLAALGLAILLDLGVRGIVEQRASAVAAGVLGVAAVGVFATFQAARFRDQVWFFGRASRNIWDQHVAVGRLLRDQLKPERVLVGDAGAIPYVADLPALDIIGLGGYSDLPFARATRLGVAAAIELLERLPNEERPDLLAIYPSWWGDFPLWFGNEIAEVPVRGNVIAGGASKVIYSPDWSPLWLSDQPHRLASGEVVDSLDFADLVNERAHAYRKPERKAGYVSMKILTYADSPHAPVWDAGRVATPLESLQFSLKPLHTGKPARLVLRAAPIHPETFELRVNGQPIPTPTLSPSDAWQDIEVPLAQDVVAPTLEIELKSRTHTITWYHLWLVQ